MAFNLFKKKPKEFVPIQEVKQKEEEQRVTGIFQKKRAEERAARRKAFLDRIERFRKTARGFQSKVKFEKRTAKRTSGRIGLGGFGASTDNLFFGEEQRAAPTTMPRRKNKKRIRRQRRATEESSQFGEFGTGRFF